VPTPGEEQLPAQLEPQRAGPAANIREAEGNKVLSRDCECSSLNFCLKVLKSMYFFLKPGVFLCLSLFYLQAVSFEVLLPITSAVFSCSFNFFYKFFSLKSFNLFSKIFWLKLNGA